VLMVRGRGYHRYAAIFTGSGPALASKAIRRSMAQGAPGITAAEALMGTSQVRASMIRTQAAEVGGGGAGGKGGSCWTSQATTGGIGRARFAQAAAAGVVLRRRRRRTRNNSDLLVQLHLERPAGHRCCVLEYRWKRYHHCKQRGCQWHPERGGGGAAREAAW
jgi:hypothetical protein